MRPEDQNCSIESAKAEPRNWDKIIIKHLAAWFVLLMVAAAIWRLATPALVWIGNGSNPITQSQESSTTASSDATNTAAKPPLEATIKTSVAGTTTTTVRATRQRQSLKTGAFQVKIIVEAINVRTAPSLNGQVITTLNQGEVVQALESKGQWLKILTSDNKEGYIHANDSLVQVIR